MDAAIFVYFFLAHSNKISSFAYGNTYYWHYVIIIASDKFQYNYNMIFAQKFNLFKRVFKLNILNIVWYISLISQFLFRNFIKN